MMLASTPPPAVSMAWFEIALIIFMVVFVLIVVWTLMCRGGHFRSAAQIPLDDATIVSPRDFTNSTSHSAAHSEDTNDHS
jgi:hypothetical protein